MQSIDFERDHKPMTDEEILAALEAMKTGNKPADPTAPVDTAVDMEAQTISGDQEPPRKTPVTADTPKSRGIKSIEEFQKSVPNVDRETDEMKSLLDEYENAVSRDKRHNALDRMQYFNTKAGEAVSMAVGGLGKNDIGPLPARASEATPKKEMFKMREDMRSHDLTSKKGDADRAQKIYSAQENNLSRENVADKNINFREEEGKRKRAFTERDHELQRGQSDLNSRRSAAAKMYMADMLVKSGVDRSVATQMVKEMYEQEERKNRGYEGSRWRPRAGVSISPLEANNASKASAFRAAGTPALDKADAIFSESPRVMLNWGSEERAHAEQVINELYSVIIKAEGDGVMQEGDLRHVKKIVGEPTDIENLASGNMPQRIKFVRELMDDRHAEYMKANNYEPGEPDQVDVPKEAARLGSTGAFAGGVKPDKKRQEAVLGGKAMPNAVPNSLPKSGKTGKIVNGKFVVE